MIESGFITPIQRMETIGELKKNENVQQDGGSLFSDIFNNAVNDVKQTQANLEQQQYLLATGQIDDAHTVPIAASEAQMAVDMLVQLRNKAIDAYNELMRISL
ncbi:flagellar hook-basal body complex protein FliE [Extibacter muris]|uniref:flagellar hook-basal body complex protein FliE n=1 Tax=Extibacter muris TaxID=1796622 RepID=UPI001D092582|nr:flagellar hook-basal body complex protein FliE [Extibacter muris]MCB6201381.1 flagellar hook-basal body complex protein FliE [Extibacter muris]MCQ4662707.1 flagellar hook-basal body complex protein FliE [Extibacter muris]MCQ4694178.1 flagellar hook-basal body complex protein FliE [Extibacter muris]